MDRLPRQVVIREVGPRDGLQSEPAIVPTDVKVALVNRLADSGLSYIQVTSFSRPERVPQHADGAEVMARIRRRPGVTYAAYVPNLRGFERALDSRADAVNMSLAASETAHRTNVGRSAAETLSEIATVADRARVAGIRMGVTISTGFGCPFEGRVDQNQVVKLAAEVASFGVDYLAVADSTGMANPCAVYDLFLRLVAQTDGPVLAAHFHESRANGLANVLAALQAGCTWFDGSVGGLGHNHYLPDGDRNVITEDLVCMLHEMGIETGIDLPHLIESARFALDMVGRSPISGVVRVGPPVWSRAGRSYLS